MLSRKETAINHDALNTTQAAAGISWALLLDAIDGQSLGAYTLEDIDVAFERHLEASVDFACELLPAKHNKDELALLLGAVHAIRKASINPAQSIDLHHTEGPAYALQKDLRFALTRKNRRKVVSRHIQAALQADIDSFTGRQYTYSPPPSSK